MITLNTSIAGDGEEDEHFRSLKDRLDEVTSCYDLVSESTWDLVCDGGVKSVDELIEKCSVLSDFKAVKSGDVWCTEKDVYQQSMSIGFLIEDIHNMLQGADDKEMNYLYRLD